MRGLAITTVILFLAPRAHSQPIDLDKTLARPLSPGAVALLVEQARDPRARQRLVEALGDGRPEVRAASARVVHASGLTDLIPEVAAALAKESNRGAASEMLWALANLGDASMDSVFLKTSRRLGLDVLAGPEVAAARGPAALDLLDSFRSSSDAFPLKHFLRLASRGNLEVLGPLVAKAFRDEDVDFWAAYLALARDTESDVPSGQVLFALTSEKLRPETLWHLLLTDVGDPKIEAASRALVSSRERATEVEDQFLRELLARQKGEKARESQSWIARRSANEQTVLSGIRTSRSNGVLLLLTKNERRALSAQIAGDPEYLDKQRELEEEAAKQGRASPAEAALPHTAETQRELRTVSGFPPGFVADLLEVTDCKPASLVGIVNATVRFSLSGRPERIAFGPDSIEPGGCAEASRTLILNSLLEPQQLSEKGRLDGLLVLLEPDALGCLAETASGSDAPEGLVRVSGNVEPPKKIRDVGPRYPESAKRERVQGIAILEAVITPSGCVKGIRVLRSPDDRLSLAAILGVSRWRYTPTLLDGVPVPIVMTVTVNFSLN